MNHIPDATKMARDAHLLKCNLDDLENLAHLAYAAGAAAERERLLAEVEMPEPMAWRISSNGEPELGTWLEELGPNFADDETNGLEYEALHTVNQLRETVASAVARERERLLDADWLSNVIRQVDGNNTMGAGALAEKIVEATRERNQS